MAREFVPYSFPRRLKPLQEYAKRFGIVVERTGKQEEKYVVKKKGSRKFLYAQNLDIAGICVEELIEEFVG